MRTRGVHETVNPNRTVCFGLDRSGLQCLWIGLGLKIIKTVLNGSDTDSIIEIRSGPSSPDREPVWNPLNCAKKTDRTVETVQTVETVTGPDRSKPYELVRIGFSFHTVWIGFNFFETVKNGLDSVLAQPVPIRTVYTPNADVSRCNVVIALKKLEEANPKFHQKLAFPSFSSARLVTMLNQSLNIQHSLWENWRQLPEMETLSNDHGCKPLNATMASTSAAVYSATVVNCNVYTSLEWTVLF